MRRDKWQGVGVAESWLDHTEDLGITVKTLVSPLSYMGAEAEECWSRVRTGSDFILKVSLA